MIYMICRIGNIQPTLWSCLCKRIECRYRDNISRHTSLKLICETTIECSIACRIPKISRGSAWKPPFWLYFPAWWLSLGKFRHTQAGWDSISVIPCSDIVHCCFTVNMSWLSIYRNNPRSVYVMVNSFGVKAVYIRPIFSRYATITWVAQWCTS